MKSLAIVLMGFLLAVGTSAIAETGQQGQKLFATAEEALAGLTAALTKQDVEAMVELFGDKSEVIFNTGDPVSDKMFLKALGAKFEERAELVPVVVKQYPTEKWYKVRYGPESWPMRVPLVNRGEGWSFELEYVTEKALRFRRELNEMVVIDTMRTLVKAQSIYVQQDRDGDDIKEFALKFISEKGTQNGLYWPVEAAEVKSPLDETVARAMIDGYKLRDGQNAYEGYLYKILTEQGRKTRGGARTFLNDAGDLTGGFLIIAYPLTWQSSGDATYIVNQRGLIWRKDLGYGTDSVASAIQAPNIDSTWFKPNPMVADLKSRLNW